LIQLFPFFGGKTWIDHEAVTRADNYFIWYSFVFNCTMAEQIAYYLTANGMANGEASDWPPHYTISGQIQAWIVKALYNSRPKA